MSTQKNPYPIRSFVDPNSGIEYRGNLFDLGEALIAAYGIRTALSYNPEPWIQVDEDGHDRPTHITLNQWADWASHVLDRPRHEVLLHFSEDPEGRYRVAALLSYARSLALDNLMKQGHELLAADWHGEWGHFDLVTQDPAGALHGHRITASSVAAATSTDLFAKEPAEQNLRQFALEHNLSPSRGRVGTIQVTLPVRGPAVIHRHVAQAARSTGGLGI